MESLPLNHTRIIIEKISSDDLSEKTAKLGDNVVYLCCIGTKPDNFEPKVVLKELPRLYGSAETKAILSHHCAGVAPRLVDVSGHQYNFAVGQLRLLREATNFFRFKVNDVFGAAMLMRNLEHPEDGQLLGPLIKKVLNLNCRNAVPEKIEYDCGKQIVSHVKPRCSEYRHSEFRPEITDKVEPAEKKPGFCLGKRKTETSFIAMLSKDPEAAAALYQEKVHNRSIKGYSTIFSGPNDPRAADVPQPERVKPGMEEVDISYRPRKAPKK